MRPVSHASLLGFLLLAVCATLSSAPATQRPTRPNERTTSQAPQSDPAAQSQPGPKAPRVQWVSAASIASRLDLSLQWLEPERKFRLKNSRNQYDFEVDSRECELAGERVFLGEAVRMVKGQPSFSLIDADKLVIPIIRPGEGASRVPGLKTIVLDPGHGGNDAGMINKRLGICEKNIALDTVLRLQKILQQEGYRVVLTRKDDRKIELPDRPGLAEKADADLFVSVHFNSVESGVEKVTGVEVFTLTPRYQLSTDQKPDPQYANIPNPGNATDHWNTVLGSAVHRRLLRDLEVPDRGLKRGRLAVLRLSTCPAILVESGYLSNDTEARKLGTPQYRQRIAEAIAIGIKDYAIAIDAARRRK